jgi:murein DD-endopeptidase MepM/ murein hydrolase activator NlpD
MHLRHRSVSGKVEPDMLLYVEKGRLGLMLKLLSRELRERALSRRGRAAGALLIACLFLTGSSLAVDPAGKGGGGAAALASMAAAESQIPGGPSASPAQADVAAGLPAAAQSSGGPASGSPAFGGAAFGGAEIAGDISADVRGSRGLFYSAYKVVKGDTLSAIAEAYNVTLDTVVSFNGIKNARALQPGTLLKIPSMAGILYTAKAGDTAESIAAANNISTDRIVEANALDSSAVKAGASLFLPDAKLPSFSLKEISGDLFKWPIRSYITSWYGWRKDPFTGVRSFHNGLDIGTPMGTSVKAAMDGTVADTGYSSAFGNYIILRHHAGWQSLYGHLKTISVKEGQRVAAGERIGYSGNSGYSTGPHLHFTVLKNGRTVNPNNVLH